MRGRYRHRGGHAPSPMSLAHRRFWAFPVTLTWLLVSCGEAAHDGEPKVASPPTARGGAQSAALKPDTAPDRTAAPVPSAYCTSDDETQALACAQGSAFRHGDSLGIQLANGKTLVRVEAPDEGTSFAHYTYRGAIRSKVMFHVVDEQLYELTSTYLIDARSGGRTVIIGDPVVDAEGTRLAAGAMSLSSCEGKDGLEIWRLTDSIPAREFSVEPFDCRDERGWAPSNVAWRSADTLAFVANLAPADSVARDAGTRDRRPAFVARDGRAWHLVLPPR